MGFSAEVNVGSRFLALRKSAFAKSGRSLGCGMLDGTAGEFREGEMRF